MTQEEVKYAIDSGKLKLNVLDKINHFIISFIFFSFPLVMLYFIAETIIRNEKLKIDREAIWIAIVFTLIGSMFFFLQKKQLKFRTLKTSLSEEDIKKTIVDICNEKDWVLIDLGNNYIKIGTFSNFLSSSYGESITVILDKNRLLINSKCKLSKRNYMFTNPNTDNVNFIFERIKYAE